MNAEDIKNDVVIFIEQFCYIKDKKTNIYHPIKLSNLQKRVINHLNKKHSWQIQQLEDILISVGVGK